MAEAHNAIAFSFAVGHEGVEVNLNHEAIKAVFRSGFRSQKKRVLQMRTNFINNVYPVDPESWIIFLSLTLGLDLVGYDVSFGVMDAIGARLGFLGLSAWWTNVVACLIFSLMVWWVIILLIRYSLKGLLTYTGWMFEPHGRMSASTKLWLVLVRLFGGRNPRLMSYQKSLPKLPVPGINDTVKRYLRSVRPLLEDREFERMEELAADFEKSLGKRLQRYLILKSWWSANYVSDWWEEYVYLRGRAPIMINSNYYGVDAVFLHPTKIQAARAAQAIYVSLTFRREVQRETLMPLRLNKTVPLCSFQYERQFNMTRTPGVESDTLMNLADSKHVSVYHKGRYFKVYVFSRGIMLQPAEIELQMEAILNETSEPDTGELELAALTAGHRVPWATARDRFFNKGVNKNSLDAIEKAAFHLVLEDEDAELDPKRPETLDAFGARMLHGKAYDRWFDKSFTLIVCKNGRLGFNAEHSWADAPILAHWWEVLISTDLIPGYGEDGHTLGEPRFQPPDPIRLSWEINEECQAVIDNSLQVARQLISDVDMHILMFDDFGKGVMKKCRVSPDAYIQMALQLTYFRDQDKFALTYEASMTRLYREGRTETVRSCTVESTAWCRAMDNKDVTKEERVKLLRAAADVHQTGYRNAMSGRGIDRHLFCLYVVSKYLNVDSPFLKEVLSEPWRLSTSQTPHQQTDKLDLKKNPDHISGGGGFGPVADDGYGVSYVIAGEDIVFFHISSKRSCDTTDSHRFGRNLKRALHDIKELFE